MSWTQPPARSTTSAASTPPCATRPAATAPRRRLPHHRRRPGAQLHYGNQTTDTDADETYDPDALIIPPWSTTTRARTAARSGPRSPCSAPDQPTTHNWSCTCAARLRLDDPSCATCRSSSRASCRPAEPRAGPQRRFWHGRRSLGATLAMPERPCSVLACPAAAQVQHRNGDRATITPITAESEVFVSQPPTPRARGAPPPRGGVRRRTARGSRDRRSRRADVTTHPQHRGDADGGERREHLRHRANQSSTQRGTGPLATDRECRRHRPSSRSAPRARRRWP